MRAGIDWTCESPTYYWGIAYWWILQVGLICWGAEFSGRTLCVRLYTVQCWSKESHAKSRTSYESVPSLRYIPSLNLSDVYALLVLTSKPYEKIKEYSIQRHTRKHHQKYLGGFTQCFHSGRTLLIITSML